MNRSRSRGFFPDGSHGGSAVLRGVSVAVLDGCPMGARGRPPWPLRESAKTRVPIAHHGDSHLPVDTFDEFVKQRTEWARQSAWTMNREENLTLGAANSTPSIRRWRGTSRTLSTRARSGPNTAPFNSLRTARQLRSPGPRHLDWQGPSDRRLRRGGQVHRHGVRAGALQAGGRVEPASLCPSVSTWSANCLMRRPLGSSTVPRICWRRPALAGVVCLPGNTTIWL